MASAQVGNVFIERVGEPLPIAVRGDRRSLSPEAELKIRKLMRREPGRFVAVLVWNWTFMLVAIVSAVYVHNIAFSLAVVIFVATRQNVLAVLLHEQVHRAAFGSRFGEYLTNLFVAYPLGVTLEQYRRVHMAHHQGFFTDRDPDFARKQGEDWTFPQLAWHLLKSFVRDLSAINLWKTIRSKRLERPIESKAPKRLETPGWLQPVFYLTIAAILTATGTWIPFLLYWVLPWATVFQAIIRWAAICEHKYNLVHPTVAEATPLIMLRWWERLLLPTLNFTTYHVYHHYYPKIPWSKLPAVHRIFREEGLVAEDKVFRGFTSYLRFLLQPLTQNEKGEKHLTASPPSRPVLD